MNDIGDRRWDDAVGRHQARLREHQSAVLELSSEVDRIESLSLGLSERLCSLGVRPTAQVGEVEFHKSFGDILKGNRDRLRGHNRRTYVTKPVGPEMAAWKIKPPGWEAPVWHKGFGPPYLPERSPHPNWDSVMILLAEDGSLWMQSGIAGGVFKGISSHGLSYPPGFGVSIMEKIDLRYSLDRFAQVGMEFGEYRLSLAPGADHKGSDYCHSHSVKGYANCKLSATFRFRLEFRSDEDIYSTTNRSIRLRGPCPERRLSEWLEGPDIRVASFEGPDVHVRHGS